MVDRKAWLCKSNAAGGEAARGCVRSANGLRTTRLDVPRSSSLTARVDPPPRRPGGWGLAGARQGRGSGRTLGLGRASSQTRPQLPIFTPRLRPAIAKFRKIFHLKVRHAHHDPADTLRPALRRDPADEYTAKIRGRYTDSSISGGYSRYGLGTIIQ